MTPIQRRALLSALATVLRNARVDKATAPVYAFQGKAFFFESAANLKQFAAAPEQFVSRGR